MINANAIKSTNTSSTFTVLESREFILLLLIRISYRTILLRSPLSISQLYRDRMKSKVNYELLWVPMLYLGQSSHSDFSLKETILICLSGALSAQELLSIMLMSPQSERRVAIVFLRSMSEVSRFDFLPSRRNNSLKCTQKYLPCLCRI